MTFSDFIDNWDHIGICNIKIKKNTFHNLSIFLIGHLTPDSFFDELTELDDVKLEKRY